MNDESKTEITDILQRIQVGDHEARERLFEILNDELKAVASAMMFKERNDHTLQPSALLNEAFIKLLSSGVITSAENRRYLFAAANRAMRQILVDHSRVRSARKRPSSAQRDSLDVVLDTLEARDGTSISDLNDALESLKVNNPRQVEVLELSFFSGLSMPEIAATLEMSTRTVERDLRLARAKLRQLLDG